jgi:molecular chaperone DnaK
LIIHQTRRKKQNLSNQGKETMSFAVGIDLGTTNSVVSVYRGGKVEALAVDGRKTLPSVVSFHDDGKIMVGLPAKRRMMIAPENTVASAKRFLGDQTKFYHVGSKSLTPSNIAAIVLKTLIEGARKALKQEDIWDAVVTIPAFFTEAQKEDTKRAAEEAGLNLLRLMPEPTAAAVAYGFDKGKDQTLLVYDLGGGTFDVSILSVRGNQFHVDGVKGDSKLGGDDIDEAVMKWVNNRFKSATGVDVMADQSRDGRKAQQRLKEMVETAKIELSESDSAIIESTDLLGHPIEIEISIDQFNSLIDPLLDRTIKCIDSVLEDVGKRPEDIDRVILVGGSTKNRRVKEVVAKKIKEPYTAGDVDQVVSQGAAILAASLFLPDADDADLPGIVCVEATAHSLGVAVMTEDRGLIFEPLIARQANLPAEGGFLGFTSVAGQTSVTIRVIRGEDTNLDNDTQLGELVLPVTPQNAQVPIGAIFKLDEDGIINFTAVQLPLGNESAPIVRHAQEHGGQLDIVAVQRLIDSGVATTKSTQIKAT